MADRPADRPRARGLTPPDGRPPLVTPAGLGEDLGGEPACWLVRVCPDCGAFNERPGACWNCGLEPDDDGD